MYFVESTMALSKYSLEPVLKKLFPFSVIEVSVWRRVVFDRSTISGNLDVVSCISNVFEDIPALLTTLIFFATAAAVLGILKRIFLLSLKVIKLFGIFCPSRCIVVVASKFSPHTATSMKSRFFLFSNLCGEILD